jgi:hypothetical protein
MRSRNDKELQEQIDIFRRREKTPATTKESQPPSQTGDEFS